MTGFLDRLPAPLRHAIIVAFGAFVSGLIPSLSALAHGTPVDWPAALVDAAGLAVAAALAAVGLNAAAPFDTQYGTGSGAAPAMGQDGGA